MSSEVLKTKSTNQSRFILKLDEQLKFLQRSCAFFDQGQEDEAIRLAAAMRIIFNQTKTSTSLLKHLGFLKIKIFSSSRGLGDYRDYLSFSISPSSSTPVKAIPMLGNAGTFKKCYFDYWWAEEPVFTHEGQIYTRKKVILSVADKDGGAHVDSELENYYRALGSGQFAFGIKGNLKYDGPAPFEQEVPLYAKNVHLALIRQFSHETLLSSDYFNWTK